ncbi:polyadenylate-binding protein-interacting protein 1-like [Mytilus edulis]|uniref:polyadenylate-binding protein-interacting protein 1-like n=1 Tax=Mytilus edulis TaxID=6550 RepID=UPI0039EEE0A2
MLWQFQNYMSEEFGQEEDSSPYDSSSSSSEDDICSTFCDIINELTLRSGNIDEITDVIVQMLQNCSDDHVMNNIIEHLFEKSIIEPDFHYTGAQLVQFLSNKLRKNPAFATFRNMFITRCKEEYLKNLEKQELISNPDKVPCLCGFVIFLGELFLNLEVTIGGVLQRIAVVRFMIRDLLLVLLEHSTNETVTCTTQVLERTGAIIVETAHLNRPEEGNFSEVFFHLQQLASRENLNQATRASISSLLNLKSRDWVRGDSSQQHSMSSLSHYEQVYHESFIDSRPSLNNENTENEVQQLREVEDSQSSIQGAMGYSSELVAETLITKEIESTGNGNQNLGDNTDDKYMCKICFDDPVEVTFLPCMHVCCCKNCSDKLKVKQCPICRKRIRQSRPLYFA